MKKKSFLLFLVALLTILPFATISEVYAKENNTLPENREEENKEQAIEEDSLRNEPAFELGDDDEKIQELKEDLTELGFAALEKPTTYYGLHTEEAVKAFQEFYNIEDTGVADEDTLLQIEYILSDHTFDREEHLEFSKSEEFVTEEEEVEELPEAEAEEDAETEAEESSENSTEESEADAEDNAEEATEEESEADAEDNAGEATEEESEADAEDNAGETIEEESEADAEDNAGEATEEESEADAEDNAGEATEEESEADAEDNAGEATEEESEADAEDNAGEAIEEESEADTEDNAGEATERETGEKDSKVEENDNQSDEVQLFSSDSNVLKKGTSSTQARKLKENLKRLGFVSIPNPNNFFGEETEKGVKEFQRYFGLEVTGVGDQATLAKLDEILSSPLQKGKRNSASQSLKEDLVALGYLSLSNPNNLYGSETEKAVKAFQKDNNLPESGIADELTL
ncbi:peptidoglycan-binding domain-containing protein, partial [Oceanobacillus oncorhynchi]|uniref:peptidoglycan-binding domain-containing protein n=1 Tax=Oceanobacillus oncorhynchi TaxID=545501 RepID=UPI002F965338